VPDNVAPGNTVHIQCEGVKLGDKSTLDVTFGDRRVSVIQIHDTNTIVVLVPQLDPGRVRVTVKEGDRLVGRGEVTIVHPSKRRLFLTYTDGEITLDRVAPYTGHFDRPTPDGPRLSYDVLNEKGVVIYTSAKPLPGSRGVEILGDPGKGGSIERLPRRGRVRFAVKIPYQAGKTVVRFYEVEPGRDLADPQAREGRRFIREIEID
jgi:hypothetical protein